MGLAFTSDQVKNISKDILKIPLQIDNPKEGTGFIQQKASVLLLKDELFLADKDQKTFSDFWADCQSRYYVELDSMTREKYEPYSEAILQLGGQQKGPHWPTSPIWTSLIPSVVPESVNCNVHTSVGKKEVDLVNDTLDLFELMTGGLSGSGNVTGTSSGSSFTTDVSVSAFTAGHVALLSGSTTALVEIIESSTGSVTDPETLETTITGTIVFALIAGTVPSGSSTITNSSPAYSNAQRTGSGTGTLGAIQGMIDQSVASWSGRVTEQFNALSENDDIPPRKPLNKTALDTITAIKDTIEAWTLNADRFTDLGLSEIHGKLNTRESEITSRTTEIYDTCLGTLEQNADGSVTGVGVNFDLFSTVSLRISKATGTLNQYYQVGGATSIFDKKIDDATAKLTQYESIFLVKPLTSTMEGDFLIDLEDTTDFQADDLVKFMDNNSVVYDRVLVAVTGNTLELDVALPSILSKGALARIVKYR